MSPGRLRINDKAEMKTEYEETGSSQITVQDYFKLPYYIAKGIKYHAAGHIYTPKPLYSTLNVTHRCNSRCVMCSEWARPSNGKELTLAEISKIFRNHLFTSIERFTLSGGEATLREDLVEIVHAVLDACPQIQHILLNTNGLDPDMVTERVNRLLIVAKQKMLNAFTVIVSLDGYGDSHQRIRRVPRAFERVSETLKRLKMLQHKIPFHLRATCVVQPLNLGNLVELTNFGQETGLPITFIPIRTEGMPITFAPACSEGTVLSNNASRDSLRLADYHFEELQNIFEHKLQPYLPPSHVLSWQEYFKIVGGERRKLPCFLRHHYIGVDSDGTLYMCFADTSLAYGNIQDKQPDKIWYSDKAKEIRKRAETYFCPKCTILCDVAFSLRSEFFYYAIHLLKEKGKKVTMK